MKKYTHKQRLAISNAYKRALDKLPDAYIAGSLVSRFICDNIGYKSQCMAYGGSGFDAHDEAKNIIHERIDGHWNVGSWLKAQSKEIRREINQDILNNNSRRIQAYRKAWLEQLITEFSK